FTVTILVAGRGRRSWPCHFFPTRRSSDLWSVSLLRHAEGRLAVRGRSGLGAAVQLQEVLPGLDAAGSQRLDGAVIVGVADDQGRAEEHTSELQSRFDLVCSLLLEKEKTEV